MSRDTWAEVRVVSHDEAQEIARRLIAGSFRRDGEYLEFGKRPRFSIPTRVNYDDDCLIMAYIAQQAASPEPPVSPAEGVMVKPLTWRISNWNPAAGRYLSSDTPVGTYHVSFHRAQDKWNWWLWGVNAPKCPGGYTDIEEEAVDLAQADFEQRIRSCLTTSPVSPAEHAAVVAENARLEADKLAALEVLGTDDDGTSLAELMRSMVLVAEMETDAKKTAIARAEAAEAALATVTAERDAALRWKEEHSYVIGHNDGFAECLRQIRDDIKFPTMIRKMWSGGEVQDWLDGKLLPARWGNAMEAAALIQPATTAGEPARDTGWLIERKKIDNEAGPFWYAETPDGRHYWTRVSTEARRWGSRQSVRASKEYTLIASDPNISVTEHVFIETAGEPQS